MNERAKKMARKGGGNHEVRPLAHVDAGGQRALALHAALKSGGNHGNQNGGHPLAETGELLYRTVLLLSPKSFKLPDT